MTDNTLTVEALAKEISRVDGGRCLGDLEIAELILPFINRHIADRVAEPLRRSISASTEIVSAMQSTEADENQLRKEEKRLLFVLGKYDFSMPVQAFNVIARMMVGAKPPKPAGAVPLPMRWHEELSGMSEGARLYVGQQEWVKFDDAIKYGDAREAAARGQQSEPAGSEAAVWIDPAALAKFFKGPAFNGHNFPVTLRHAKFCDDVPLYTRPSPVVDAPSSATEITEEMVKRLRRIMKDRWSFHMGAGAARDALIAAITEKSHG